MFDKYLTTKLAHVILIDVTAAFEFWRRRLRFITLTTTT